MDNLTPVFIFLTGVAVMLQAGILLAMYLAMRKSGERMEALATEVKTKVLPTVEQAEAMLAEIRPKLQVIADNLQESTTVLRDQVQRVDATVKDAVDRGRLQIIRADELLTRTLDRVEQTSDMVHQHRDLAGSPAFRADAGNHSWPGVFVWRAWAPKWRQSRRAAASAAG